MHSIARRTISAAGIALVGDSLDHALGGRKRLKAWSSKIAPWSHRKSHAAFRKSMRLLLGVSAAELAAGVGMIALARRSV